MKTILCLAIISISALHINAQDSMPDSAKNIVRKMKASIAAMKSGEMSVSYKIKYTESNDTLIGMMKVRFMKNQQNKLGILINATVINGPRNFQMIYDGQNIFRTEIDKKTILRIDPEIYGYGHIIFYSPLYYLFAPQHPLLIDNSIDSLFADKLITEIKTGKDTIIENKYCVEILIRYRPLQHFYKTRITTVYVDSKKFTPIKSMSLMVSSVDETQFNEFDIEYDSTNSLKNISEFSFESLPVGFVMQDFSDNKKEQTQFIATGSPAPDFSLPDLNDKTVSLRNFSGKLILLDFWHLHCGYCILSMPEAQAMSDKYKSDNLVVMGINPYDKDKDKLRKFFAANNINFTQLINGLNVNELYKVYAHPAYYLIDKHGLILYAGIFNKEKLEFLIGNEISRAGK